MLLYLVPMLGHSLFRICSLSSLSRFLSLKMPEEESDLGALDLGGSDGGLGGSDAPADSKALDVEVRVFQDAEHGLHA